MLCEYCDTNTATVEVAINDTEAIHLCWFCAERKEEIINEEIFERPAKAGRTKSDAGC